jgi:hypothetical protein
MIGSKVIALHWVSFGLEEVVKIRKPKERWNGCEMQK